MAEQFVRVTRAVRDQAYAEVDWARLDAMTDEDIEQQVRDNPDAAPILTRAEMAAGLVAAIRHRLALTQVAFARHFGIPTATLRDWEQGRRVPDPAVWCYLKVIAREPEMVVRALSNTPTTPPRGRRAAVRTSPPRA